MRQFAGKSFRKSMAAHQLLIRSYCMCSAYVSLWQGSILHKCRNTSLGIQCRSILSGKYNLHCSLTFCDSEHVNGHRSDESYRSCGGRPAYVYLVCLAEPLAPSSSAWPVAEPSMLPCSPSSQQLCQLRKSFQCLPELGVEMYTGDGWSSVSHHPPMVAMLASESEDEGAPPADLIAPKQDRN